MADFKHSNKAEADLVRAIKYSLKHHGARQADRYLSLLEDACPLLGEIPNPGTPAYIRGRKRPLWKLPVADHVIYYRFNKTHVFIVRVLHRSELPELHL